MRRRATGAVLVRGSMDIEVPVSGLEVRRLGLSQGCIALIGLVRLPESGTSGGALALCRGRPVESPRSINRAGVRRVGSGRDDAATLWQSYAEGVGRKRRSGRTPPYSQTLATSQGFRVKSPINAEKLIAAGVGSSAALGQRVVAARRGRREPQCVSTSSRACATCGADIGSILVDADAG
jgi:hypothetical protein